MSLTGGVKSLNEYGDSFIRPYFLCFALIIPVVQMMFIEVDVDLSYALYFSALVYLVGQESRIVDQRLYSLFTTGIASQKAAYQPSDGAYSPA